MRASVRGPDAGPHQCLAGMVLVRFFGYPAIERDGSRAPIGVPPKAVALLAILAANHTRPLSRDWLAQSLWPDADAVDGRANLRRQLHLLSKAVGEETLLLTRHTAQWNGQSNASADVIRFEALARTEPALAIQEYGGEFCAGIEDDVLDALRTRYRSAYETLLRTLVENARRAGNDTALAIWLQHAINHDPLDEAAVREVMQLRRRHGDRAGALREYNAFSQRLRSELACEPDEQTQTLFREIAVENPAGAVPHNLQAPATTFVGRERELAQMIQALAQARVVTLTGAGGIGKTRLAMRACFDALRTFTHGIWFVELDRAAGAPGVWERLAETLAPGTPGDSEKFVLDYLAGKKILIVLDTCEHLVDDVRRIAMQIAGAGAGVLCTSRRALRAQGEHVIDIGPLELPPAELRAGESALRYGAYRLFVERAAMINPTFRVHARQTRALTEVLQRVDGLPLAIELVASRANVLTIEGMRARLATAMRTAPKHSRSARAQTIDATISWSYELLSREQRTLFAWLSAFSGRFTIEDVERVCAGVSHAVESLLELVDASLVAIVPGETQVHYRLLETTREFARARLKSDGGEHAAFLAHAEHAAQKADGLTALSNAHYDLSVPLITADIHDYLTALERCVENGWIALGARILEGLHRYGLRRHYCGDLLRLALALLELPGLPPESAARVHRFVGAFAPARGLLSLALEHIETACAFYRESGDEGRLCDALGAMAVISFEAKRYDDTERLLLEVHERARRLGDEALLFKTVGRLGGLYLSQRDFERARANLTPAAAGLRKAGELHQLAFALKNLAVAEHYSGQHDRAIEYAAEALTLPSAAADASLRTLLVSLQANAHREAGRPRDALELVRSACPAFLTMSESSLLAECVEDAATTFASVAAYETSARVFGYAEALRRRIGSEINPGLRDFYERTVGQLQAALGPRLIELQLAGELESLDSLVLLIEEAADRIITENEDTTSLS